MIGRKWNTIANKRICPKCKKPLRYTNRKSFCRACRNNTLCRKCGTTGTSGGWNRGKIGVQSSPMKGKRNPGLSKYMKENNPSWRPDVRQKLRERRLEKVTPCFNPIACQKIDEYGKKYGYHFQHAMNGGEVHIIGYSVDGYDKDNNVVIEYYEPWHSRTKKQDERRKKRIIGHLGCKFIELKENNYDRE